MNWREYQALQKVVEIGDRFVSYVDEGERASRSCFIHGIPTWGYLWHRFIAALSRARRVLIPDLLGLRLFGPQRPLRPLDRAPGRGDRRVDGGARHRARGDRGARHRRRRRAAAGDAFPGSA